MSEPQDPLDALTNLFASDVALNPDAEFASNLRRRIDHLEQRARRSATTNEGATMASIIPYLAVTNGRGAIDFYSEVFGAEIIDGELFEMDDGRLGHVSLAIGDAKLYVSDEFPEVGAIAPETLGGSTAGIVIHVDNADDTMASAIAAGATLDRPAEDRHGSRSGWFVDPWGHRWSPTSSISG